jgi:DNA-binding winged helix-turn-helix (wHTH) protein
MKIVRYLCNSPGHNVSQEQLEYAIWQDEPAGYRIAVINSLYQRINHLNT